MDILLFQSTEKLASHCQLKNFIHFLHCNGIKGPIRFAFIEADAPLLNNLTIRQNIHLDSIPQTMTQSGDFQLKEHLQENCNPHLSKILDCIGLLDELPTNVDDQTRKLAGLLKGLLQKADYLFLESPEKYLSKDNLKIFIKAMEFQTANTGQIVFINSDQESLWHPYISKTVSRRPSENFEILAVNKQGTGEPFQEAPETKEGVLQFYNLDKNKGRAA
ncbi:MAG: hypothetical protein HN509_16850 [Halobacteriovoraceae bacterium]|nr:hypothetical protein [Halobacteriovoraceae bacterium]MBT5095755.1 hypothetical protein [Halobacteriovoraceae bacterium]